MMITCRTYRIGAAVAVTALASFAVGAQSAKKHPASKDSVVVKANGRYGAGQFHRKMLGDTYRDVWGTPIKVPVLDLKTYAGGLKPTEVGGTAQTKSLRFVGADGRTYTFRPVYKDRLAFLEPFENTIIVDIFRDGLSALHPTGPLGAAPFMRAGGVLHPEPTLFVLPNDPALGEFREEFAGRLGAIEEHATMPEEGPGLGGALDIIGWEDLLKRLNKDARTRVDARKLLTARLLDMLLNDNDRHRDQWRWALLQQIDTTGPWVPIARDRDAVFVHHDGFLLGFARKAKKDLVEFTPRYPNLTAFAGVAIDFDQRLLIGLEKRVWDSVATWLKTQITDSVIDAAIRNMPREYYPLSADIIRKLRSRRDLLWQASDAYYRILAHVPEIHATDSDDQATVIRDGTDVIVRVQTGNDPPWFERRFKPSETREIRLYLHEGNDRAVVTGNVASSIMVRVVGGNGTNTLMDSSSVGSPGRLTRLHDQGEVDDVKYGKDEDFNRRPWVQAYGKDVPPLKDRGSSARPSFGFGGGQGLGTVTRVGYDRYTYGFRYIPYKDKAGFEVGYATNMALLRTAFMADRRIENSQLHYLLEAEMSQFEIVETRGLGNTVPDSDDLFFDLKQSQWMLRPAVGLALGSKGDLSLGPIVKYVSTDSVPNKFISESQPLGFPRFGQAGMQLAMDHDTRDSVSSRGFVIRATSSYYAQVWDAKKPFGEISAVVSTYLTAPVWPRPTLALRGGGKRVFGEAPYFEAAFIGGRRSLRTVKPQRFAGDASLHGTAELRVPLLRFNHLLPWSIGALGFMEAGRVYNNGESPGTWHSAQGLGGWIGLLSPKYAIHIVRTNKPDRRMIVGTGFAF
jgi:hypothetical protein